MTVRGKNVCLKVNDCFMIYDKAINLCAKRREDQRESHPIMNPEAACRLHVSYLVSR